MEPLKVPFLIPIEYPKPDFKISTKNGKQFIWDGIRKKMLVLTPEEWVRQNFIRFLTRVMHYPASLLALEKEIRLASRKKRCDIIVYKKAVPWMIVECKETRVPLNQKTLEQIINYNMSLQVPYLVLTNGETTYAVQRDSTSWNYIRTLPPWKE